MNIFFISSILTAISSFGFGVLVLFRSSNKSLAWKWFVFVNSVALWGLGAVWIAIEKDAETALLLWRVVYGISVIWISPLFYHFVCSFLDRRSSCSIRIHYGIGLFCLFIIPTKAFFPLTRLMFGLNYARGAWAFDLFCIWWWGLVMYSHILLAKSQGLISSAKKNQIRYFFLATAIGFSGGVVNFLGLFGFNIYPWGQCAIPLYPLIMSYAILKHQLMDVRLVIRKTLIYSMVTALLTAVYVVIIFGLATILQRKVSNVPAASSYAVAAIAITLLFHPLRMRVQRWVDRYFFHVLVDGHFVQELTSGFVHELKRPLATIISPAELALMDIRDILEGRKRMEDQLPLTAQRLQHIVSAALDASHRIEAVRELNSLQKQSAQRVMLSDVLQKALDLERNALRYAQVRVKNKIPSNLFAIIGHAGQLELVFMNLVRNAIEAMEQSATRELVIECIVNTKTMAITIADSGPGIAPDQQSRIFEPYFTTKSSRGMGMGLYLSQQVIKAHGGSLRIDPSFIRGARFVVELPVER